MHRYVTCVDWWDEVDLGIVSWVYMLRYKEVCASCIEKESQTSTHNGIKYRIYIFFYRHVDLNLRWRPTIVDCLCSWDLPIVKVVKRDNTLFISQHSKRPTPMSLSWAPTIVAQGENEVHFIIGVKEFHRKSGFWSSTCHCEHAVRIVSIVWKHWSYL